jgi:NAD(P)-dependent dehydrogenase (short-subunit alcohol dehydrogenase family)
MDLLSLFTLENKTALITGGTKGIGAMIAEGFIAAGCRVYISSRNAQECVEAATKMDVGPGSCLPLPADISSLAGIEQLVSEYLNEEGSLNILVNNAGVTWADSFVNFPEAGWDSVMNTNLKAAFFLSQKMLAPLKAAASKEDPSRIINISSMTARKVGGLNDFPYRASKAALNHLTRMLAIDLAPAHINTNAIAPGIFPSYMSLSVAGSEENLKKAARTIPVQRVGRAEDVAGIAIYMASKSGSYMNGDIVTVDGGRVHS